MSVNSETRIAIALGAVFVCVWLYCPQIATAQEEDRVAVERVVKGIIEADNLGDLERIMTYYAENAVLIPPSGATIEGKAAIRAHYGKLFGGQPFAIDNEITETVVSDGLAVTRGINSVESTSAEGVVSRGTSRYLMTLTRVNPSTRWQIAHLMWTSEPQE